MGGCYCIDVEAALLPTAAAAMTSSKKGPVPAASDHEEDGEDNEDDRLYYVEQIVKTRLIPAPGNGASRREVFITWEGYSSKNNSWEPVSLVTQSLSSMRGWRDIEENCRGSAPPDYVISCQRLLRRRYRSTPVASATRPPS